MQIAFLSLIGNHLSYFKDYNVQFYDWPNWSKLINGLAGKKRVNATKYMLQSKLLSPQEFWQHQTTWAFSLEVLHSIYQINVSKHRDREYFHLSVRRMGKRPSLGNLMSEWKISDRFRGLDCTHAIVNFWWLVYR